MFLALESHKLEPRAPPLFSIAANINHFFKFGLAVKLDLTILLTDSFILIAATIGLENEAKNKFSRCTQ